VLLVAGRLEAGELLRVRHDGQLWHLRES
jgi:hypothetical protein